MSRESTDLVTGAFSFTGRYVAERLLSEGRDVRTLTNHPGRRTEFSDRVEAHPYAFDDPAELVDSLRGVETLYNTYWIRFPHDDVTFADAVENTRTLVEAAEAAGVRRLVQFSVSNASRDGPPYYRAKAAVEELVAESPLSVAVLRPTLIFGRGDILVNNIAWFLRRSPVFGVFGDGSYRVQPVYAGDVADVAVRHGRRDENVTLDVGGPETVTFDGLLRQLARLLDARCRILPLPPRLAYGAVKILELFVDDTVLTWNEARALMGGYLATETPSRGTTRFTSWVEEHADQLGTDYTSFGERHRR